LSGNSKNCNSNNLQLAESSKNNAARKLHLQKTAAHKAISAASAAEVNASHSASAAANVCSK
jgi:hypothetical protein